MITDAVLVEIIGTLGLVFVAILQLRSELERKRRKAAELARDKKHDEQRHDDMEMEIAKGKVMLASGELAFVTSIAVTGGHTNGNVKKAQEDFRQARVEYDELETVLARKYLKSKQE